MRTWVAAVATVIVVADRAGYCCGAHEDGPVAMEQIPANQQDVLMAKILEEAKSGDMPPLQYRCCIRRCRFRGAMCRRCRCWARVRVGARRHWLEKAMPCTARRFREALHKLPCDGDGPQGAEAGRSVRQEGRKA
jgi:hypothetical protein